jgi:aminopeptidase-like protein
MLKKQLNVVLESWDSTQQGRELYDLVAALYPICRSITGDGLRQSLRLLQQHVPLSLREIPTGTQIFDWTVPKEWNIRDAYIMDSKGKRFVDFKQNNLHVVNYSIPVRTRMDLTKLKQHIYTLPETPDWIPYRTSYYKETWGFCMSQRKLDELPDDEYEVCIDSILEPGHLTYGELRIQGVTDEEVLISCHSCHPSLCNDNLSGMTVAAKLAECLVGVSLRYSYRLLWVPGTIGAITWLSQNESVIPFIKHGLVLSCVGDSGQFTYKSSRRGNAEIDRVVANVLQSSKSRFGLMDFTPNGYDERQYCSPGINLPVGCFMRTPNGKFPQYHTSADDLKLVTAPALAESAFLLLNIISVLENNHRYLNLNPKCEPQLGRRGLYRQVGGTNSTNFEEAMLWVLNLSDGDHSLLNISERSKLSFATISKVADELVKKGLLERL